MTPHYPTPTDEHSNEWHEAHYQGYNQGMLHALESIGFNDNKLMFWSFTAGVVIGYFLSLLIG